MEVELGGSEGSHDGVEDTELPGGEGSDHDATGEEPVGAELDHADLSCDASEAGEDGSLSSGSGLVDHGEEGVSRVGDDGGRDSGNHTYDERRAKRAEARSDELVKRF